jgi:hypothetical protein
MSVAGLAAPTVAPVRAEIDALLARLEASGCRFGRNEEWHAGAADNRGLRYTRQNRSGITRLPYPNQTNPEFS